MILAAATIVEAFAVLTRLPAPHRLSGQDAFTLLESNWGRAEVVILNASEYWRVLKNCRDQSITGGQVYDAVIAACASKGRADRLLTWNFEHFAPFQGDFEVTVPGPS